MSNEISWDDFEKVQLCVGTVIEVEDFPEARKPAWKLTVDFGDEIQSRNRIGFGVKWSVTIE